MLISSSSRIRTQFELSHPESVEAVSKYALLWNNDINLDISIVLEDEENMAVAKDFASGS